MARYLNKTATILEGQFFSSPVDCSAGAPVFLFVPQQWTPAPITFQVSPDGAAWFDLVSSTAGELSFNVRAGTAVRLDPVWQPVTQLRIRSGRPDYPVPQSVDASLLVVVDTAAAV